MTYNEYINQLRSQYVEIPQSAGIQQPVTTSGSVDSDVAAPIQLPQPKSYQEAIDNVRALNNVTQRSVAGSVSPISSALPRITAGQFFEEFSKVAEEPLAGRFAGAIEPGKSVLSTLKQVIPAIPKTAVDLIKAPIQITYESTKGFIGDILKGFGVKGAEKFAYSTQLQNIQAAAGGAGLALDTLGKALTLSATGAVALKGKPQPGLRIVKPLEAGQKPVAIPKEIGQISNLKNRLVVIGEEIKIRKNELLRRKYEVTQIPSRQPYKPSLDTTVTNTVQRIKVLNQELQSLVNQHKEISKELKILEKKQPTGVTNFDLQKTNPEVQSPVSAFFEAPEFKLPKFSDVPVVKRGIIKQALEFLGFRSRGTAIGPLKEFFTKEFQIVREYPAAKAGEFNANLIKLTKQLKPTREEIFNLQDVMEGRAAPLNERVSQLYELINKELGIIQALRNTQEPGFGRANYYTHKLVSPKVLKRSKEIYADVLENMERKGIPNAKQLLDDWISGNDASIVNYLIRTKQVTNEADGISTLQMMRRRGPTFGPFEPRTIDLPFYDPNPLRVIPGYIEGAYKKLFLDDRYGTNGEGLWDAVDIVGKTGGNEEAARTAVNLLFDIKQHSSYEGLAQTLRDIQTVEKMSLSAIPNFFQNFLGSSLQGTIRNAFRGSVEYRKNLEAAHDWALRVGQHPMGATFFMENPGSIASSFLKKAGFTKTEANNYVKATVTGRIVAQDLFNQLIKNPASFKIRKEISRLGLDADKLLKQGGLTAMDFKIAADNFWRRANAIPDPLNQPQTFLGFDVTKPAGQLIYQFKSVAYRQATLAWERAVKDAMHGDFRGLIKLAIIYPAVGEIIQDIKSVLTFRKRPTKLVLRILDNYQAAFTMGILENTYYYTKYGLDFGPTYKQLEEIITGRYKQQIRNIPFIGQAIYNITNNK